MKTLKLFVTILLLTSLKFVSAQEVEKHYFANIDSIYDGDTFTVMIDLGFETYKLETIRIARIDTPELRGKETAISYTKVEVSMVEHYVKYIHRMHRQMYLTIC